MHRFAAALAAFAAALIATGPARGRAATRDDSGLAAVEALVHRGELDESEHAYERALADDRAAIAAAPDSGWAERASARVRWLEARAEGDFAPLARLEGVRKDPSSVRDPEALDALSRDADAFPPGRVRGEAHLFVAHAWLGALARPERARAELRKVADDPQSDPVLARLAARELVESWIAAARPDRARDEVLARARALDPAFATHVLRVARRPTIAIAASIELAAYFIMVGAAAWQRRDPDRLRRTARALRRVAPSTALTAAAVAAGGVLASAYEEARAAPFVALAVGIGPIALAAAVWNASGSARTPARVARAIGSLISVGAAAYLALFETGSNYLEGFGL